MEFNPKELLAQAQRASQEIQEKMRATNVEASSGGGTVSVKMNGQKQLLAVKIDPEAVKSGDVEMLQDLITAAVNEASRKMKSKSKQPHDQKNRKNGPKHRFPPRPGGDSSSS